MQHRVLGKTGLEVSVIGFGGIPIRLRTKQEAAEVLRRALDLGVTYFDTARGYGDSEEKFAAGLARADCIIGSKSPKRTGEEITQDVETSLRTLQRDHIHLYQLHGVAKDDALDACLAPGGAVEALVRAKEQGKIGHIGITGHFRPVLVRAVREAGEVIESVQALVSPLEADDHLRDPSLRSTGAFEELLAACREQNVGIIAMKVAGGGVFPQPTAAAKWVLGHEEVACANIGMSTLAEVEDNAAAGTGDLALTPEDEAAIQELERDFERLYCRRCGLCQPCPKGIDIVSVLIGDSMVMRMGGDLYHGRGFKDKLTKIQECHDCAVCLPKCPYELNIPELLPRQAAKIRKLAASL